MSHPRTRKPVQNKREHHVAQPRKKAPNPSSLADALRNTPSERSAGGFSCAIDRIRNQMDATVRQLLDDRISDIRKRRSTVAPQMSGGVNSSWLAKTLSENGFPISALTVQKHVAQRCRCGY
jgi:hypothetical protein